MKHYSRYFLLPLIVVLYGFLSNTASAAPNSAVGYQPKEGAIPNPKVAVEVARAIANNIYGAENIKRQEPLKATLMDEVWIVEGQLPNAYLGGVVTIKIQKSDGRVLSVMHSQ